MTSDRSKGMSAFSGFRIIEEPRQRLVRRLDGLILVAEEDDADPPSMISGEVLTEMLILGYDDSALGHGKLNCTEIGVLAKIEAVEIDRIKPVPLVQKCRIAMREVGAE